MLWRLLANLFLAEFTVTLGVWCVGGYSSEKTMSFLETLPDSFFINSTRSLPNLKVEYQTLDDLSLLRLAARQLKELIVQVQNKPRPSYDVDGQEVKWNEYLDSLYKRLRDINELISMEEGPTEEETWAWT